MPIFLFRLTFFRFLSATRHSQAHVVDLNTGSQSALGQASVISSSSASSAVTLSDDVKVRVGDLSVTHNPQRARAFA